jgi:hypothetical protein
MTLKFNSNMTVLSLLVLKKFSVSLPAPSSKWRLTSNFVFLFFAGFVAAGKRVARRRLFAVLTQFYNTEQPKRRRYKRERESESERERGTRESESESEISMTYIHDIDIHVQVG